MLTGMSVATESIRWALLESLERSYYVGKTAGQRWLPAVSAFLDSLSPDDHRLVRLAAMGVPNLLGDFIAGNPPPQADRFAPSGWLDGYVGWVERRALLHA